MINKYKWVLLGGVLLIATSVPGVYFYIQYKKAAERLANPGLFAQEETSTIIASVGKLMMLPADETPTVANINDKDKLANQPFFTRAQNGDKVLIYTNAKKAILYRQSINKIIEVAPINIGATASAAPVVTPQTQAPSFAIFNGTDVVGLANTFEEQLKVKVPNSRVLDRDNAKKQDYSASLLIDVAGTRQEEASQLAASLGLTISTLPSGEAAPASDFLIILGSDKK